MAQSSGDDLKETQKDVEEFTKFIDKREPSSPILDINKVFEVSKFGRFHMRMLVTTFAGIIASILATTSSSYLLPIAECDLNMNLKEKGLLTAIPFLGMVISTLVSGYLIDTFGRIIFLKIGYGGIYIFTVFSAFSQNYATFVAAKFGEGVFTGVANSGILSLTSEFCHPDVRDRIMIFQSTFIAMAQIICPAMAWGILTQNWEWSPFGGVIVLRTWNWYLFTISLWSLLGFVLYTTLPESPKFLATHEKYLEARNVLIKVYTENTGKNADTFPYHDLWSKEITEQNTRAMNQKSLLLEFRDQLLVGLRNMKPLVVTPYIIYFCILGIMLLAIVGIGDVLKIWFPQLSTIVEHYNFTENQNLCILLDKYTEAENLRISNTTTVKEDPCVPQISGSETYINSIIIGLISIIPYFVSGIIINKVGKKCLLILAAAICICGIMGIRWAISETMMVSLFSIDIAVLQTMKSLTQMVVLEAFPTTIRSVAMSLVIMLSRLGTLIGNISFPILLNMGCEVPFYTMAGLMMCVMVLAMFTPKNKEG